MSKETEKKEWYKTWWGIVLAILILPYFAIWYLWSKTKLNKPTKIFYTIIIVFFVVIAFSDSNTSTSVNTSSSGELSTKNQSKNQAIQKTIGEEIITNTYKLKVNSVEEKNVVAGSSSPKSATPGAKFVIVNLDITNNTSENYTFFPNYTINLIDRSGRKFKTYEDSIGSIENYLEVQDLSPGIKKTGNLLYEIPKESVNYDLFVRDEGTAQSFQIKLK